MLKAQLVSQGESRINKPLQMNSMFDPDMPEQVSLRTSLTAEKVASTLSLLREFTDVFTWSHADMAGVLPKLVEHRLSLQDSCRLVRQRLRRLHPALQEVIKQEVDGLLEAYFIKKI